MPGITEDLVVADLRTQVDHLARQMVRLDTAAAMERRAEHRARAATLERHRDAVRDQRSALLVELVRARILARARPR